MPKSKTASADDIIDRLNPEIIAFIQARIAELGEEESGAYNYYAYRAEKGQGLSHYEQALLRYLMDANPSQVVHAGIGIGTLDVAIGLAGIPVVGYERDRTRFAAAEALRDKYGLKYELRQEFYPDGLETLKPGGMLVFTNVGAGWSLEDEARITRTFSHFDQAVLDLKLFGVFRPEEEEREELLNRLKKVGKVAELPTIAGAAYVAVTPRAGKPR